MALVVLLAGGVLVWRSLADGCGGDRDKVTVIADSSMADPLKALASIASGESCYDFRVAQVPSTDVPALLTAGGDGADLWVADSTSRATRVTTQVRKKLDFVTKSLASSPVVVAGTALGDLATWVDVMNLPNLQVGGPIENSSGEVPIIGGVSAVSRRAVTPDAFSAAMAKMSIIRKNVAKAEDTDDARLKASDASAAPAVTSEQQYLSFLRSHNGSRLAAKVPADGTVMLGFPLVNTAPAGRKDLAAGAGKALASAAASGKGRKALNDAGFRNPDGTGVGDDVRLLATGDQANIDAALRSWQRISIPMRMLNLIDVSGSMRTPAGNSTRAALVAGTVSDGTALFGNSSQVGTWIFAIDRGGNGQDWKELVPIKRLDDAESGISQRARVTSATRDAMSTQLGGGTGLYDSTLAAYRSMVESYDPTAVNTLAVITDGRNEDAQSIGLEDLLGQLRALQDPGRPVRIVALGITDDADEASLKRIADVTGGTSYIARTPNDISGIFTTEITKWMKD
ncbi:MAG: substrate-binding domain-containing protein [Gordonia amarae]